MCLSRLAEYDEVDRGAPFLVLPRAPRTLNPPLAASPFLTKQILDGTEDFWRRICRNYVRKWN